MSPVVLLGLGLTLLLALGIPLLRRERANAAHDRHMEARLATLRAPLEEIEDLVSPRNQAYALIDHAPRGVRVGLARAGMTLSWRSVIVILAGLTTIGGLTGWLGGLLMGAMAVIIVAFGGVMLFKIIVSRRLAAFVDGLPLYLDATRQLIMVGNALQQAMVKAGEGCSPGVARHLAPMLRRIQYGAPPGDSIIWLADRIDVIELHMLAAAVQTNTRYGGRISTVLANLTQILRDRARVERELHAATAETRLSAIVLGALPVVVASFIAFTNPSYIGFFIDRPEGHDLMAVAVGMEIAGVLVMRRIMQLDF